MSKNDQVSTWEDAINKLGQLVKNKPNGQFDRFPIFFNINELIVPSKTTSGKTCVEVGQIKDALKNIVANGQHKNFFTADRSWESLLVNISVYLTQTAITIQRKRTVGDWYFYMDVPENSRLIKVLNEHYKAAVHQECFWATLPIVYKDGDNEKKEPVPFRGRSFNADFEGGEPGIGDMPDGAKVTQSLVDKGHALTEIYFPVEGERNVQFEGRLKAHPEDYRLEAKCLTDEDRASMEGRFKLSDAHGDRGVAVEIKPDRVRSPNADYDGIMPGTDQDICDVMNQKANAQREAQCLTSQCLTDKGRALLEGKPPVESAQLRKNLNERLNEDKGVKVTIIPADQMPKDDQGVAAEIIINDSPCFKRPLTLEEKVEKITEDPQFDGTGIAPNSIKPKD